MNDISPAPENLYAPEVRERNADEVIQVSWSGMSHLGKVRDNNEDAFLALTLNRETFHLLGKYGETPLTDEDFIFAVSDGMGGANAGEFASKIATEKLTRILPKAYNNAASGMHLGFTDLFEEAFQEIHKAMIYLGDSYPECKGMGSTLTLIWVTPQWVYFGHIGDSRLYYLPQGGPLKQLSEDHSHVGWLLRQGKITEREARVHPRRHSLQKALGAGHQFVSPQVGAISLQRGDRFMLCSDGVIEGLSDRKLHYLLYEPSTEERQMRPAELLVERAIDISGSDNTTALVIEIS